MKRSRFRVKITIPGTVFIALTIILGVAAINTGNNLLYIIAAFMLSIMALSGLSSFLNLFFLVFEIETPKEIYADQRVFLNIKIKNKNPYLPSFLLKIKTPYSDTFLDFLPAKKETSVFLWVKFLQRGWQKLPDLAIFSYFPLNFFSRGFNFYPEKKCLVYPKPIVCSIVSPTIESKTEYSTGKQKGEEDFKGLRELVTGDHLRGVHWLATARTGKFMLKEYEGGGTKEILLTLSEKVVDLETELGRLTYLTNLFLKKGYAVGLKTPSVYLIPKRGEIQREKILKTLALYES